MHVQLPDPTFLPTDDLVLLGMLFADELSLFSTTPKACSA